MNQHEFIAAVRTALTWKTKDTQDHHLWVLHSRMQKSGERAVFEKIGAALVESLVKDPPTLGAQLVAALRENDEAPSPHG